MNGVTQIQLRTGLNCWQGRCFRYNRFVSVPGREPVPIPEDVEVIDGFVTEDGFARILAAARAAPPEEGGGNGGDRAEAGGGDAPAAGGGDTGPGGIGGITSAGSQ